MRAGGIPAENIITMMYNDVPNDQWNPFPGELYNRPGDDSPDVYKGVVVDYEGDDVSVENFLMVLVGDESTGKKVLKSTAEDNVFLFYSNHGGPDILGMPTAGYLYSKDLLDAIQTMHEKQMYNKFVLYVEACNSGSMFLNLPEDLNVLAVTSANDQESSWGWYCGYDAVVKGKNVGSCLGDEFSISWMEDADKGMAKTETLEDQFNYLVKQVSKSHVMRYGDVSFANDPIGEFIGYPEEQKRSETIQPTTMWDSRDNEMLFYRHMMKTTTGAEQKKWTALYEKEMEHREQIDRYFHAIAKSGRFFKAAGPVKNFNCYKAGIEQFEKTMGKSDYGMKYFGVIANMCAENPHAF